MADMHFQTCTDLSAVQGVEVEAEFVLGVQCLDVEIILREVAIVDGIDEVVCRMAVAHLELPCRLRLVISHVLDACAHMHTLLLVTSASARICTFGEAPWMQQWKGQASQAGYSSRLHSHSQLGHTMECILLQGQGLVHRAEGYEVQNFTSLHL